MARNRGWSLGSARNARRTVSYAARGSVGEAVGTYVANAPRPPRTPAKTSIHLTHSSAEPRSSRGHALAAFASVFSSDRSSVRYSAAISRRSAAATDAEADVDDAHSASQISSASSYLRLDASQRARSSNVRGVAFTTSFGEMR
jgi:hypothetical protein